MILLSINNTMHAGQVFYIHESIYAIAIPIEFIVSILNIVVLELCQSP